MLKTNVLLSQALSNKTLSNSLRFLSIHSFVKRTSDSSRWGGVFGATTLASFSSSLSSIAVGGRAPKNNCAWPALITISPFKIFISTGSRMRDESQNRYNKREFEGALAHVRTISTPSTWPTSFAEIKKPSKCKTNLDLIRVIQNANLIDLRCSRMPELEVTII